MKLSIVANLKFLDFSLSHIFQDSLAKINNQEYSSLKLYLALQPVYYLCF